MLPQKCFKDGKLRFPRKKKVVEANPSSNKISKPSNSSVSNQDRAKVTKAIPKTSSVSSSLDEVRKKLASQKVEEEKAKEQSLSVVQEIRRSSFTYEDLESAWNVFITKEESKVNQVILNSAAYSLNGTEVSIYLESTLQATQFQKIQPPLKGHLIRTLQNDEIEFKVEVKELPKEGKRLYTHQDKFDYLAEKYPELLNLKNQLGLDWQS